MVDRYVVHHEQAQGESDTESHCRYHHHRVCGTGNTDQQVIIDHIVYKINQRYARYDE